MQASKNMLLRAGLIYVAVALLAVGIFVSAVTLQFNPNLKHEGVQTRYDTIPAQRGDILARDGRLLVTSVPSYYLYIDAVAADSAVFYHEVAALSNKLADLFGDKSAADYEKQLRDARKNKKRYLRMGDKDKPQWISYGELLEVKKYPVLKKGARSKSKDGCEGWGGGLIAQERNERKRFYDGMALRTLGWLNTQGKYVGLEGHYDYALKGVAGKRLMQKTGGGDYIPVNNVPEMPPRNGLTLVSTIDVDMQDAAETALRRQLSIEHPNVVFEAGCAVVMEVETGAVRAIANLRRNLNGSYSEDYNYAVGRATDPGSTFKLCSLIALLEDNKVSLSDTVDTGNGRWTYSKHTIKDVSSAGYGAISVQQAFEKSSNVGFAKLLVENYSGDERRYVDKLYAMKLNEKMNLQIPGEAEQQVNYLGDKKWSKLSLPMMAIGYEVLITPLKTLTLYNAIANNGRMMKPLFATELRDDKRAVESFSSEVTSNAICSPSTLKKVQQALEGVVERGTATNIRDTSYYRIAGKTGTARLTFDGGKYEQDGLRKYQASFAGYFPADKPKYSMVVVLYSEPTKSNGIYGAAWAAPVFKEIADKIYINSPEWAEEVKKPTGTQMMADLIKQNAANRKK
ncbi:MAG: penicillin-binding protein 2 [Bacteroidales bacterium]|nr:penicillin-binding protein 2 [Bacteroidales bacterium]MCL2133229.1 penicillin-binding protein 2 [Bacteroidales bacterium]MCL2133585.1 penicillin-binding protein 2 [Bacteroidales bacterium]